MRVVRACACVTYGGALHLVRCHAGNERLRVGLGHLDAFFDGRRHFKREFARRCQIYHLRQDRESRKTGFGVLHVVPHVAEPSIPDDAVRVGVLKVDADGAGGAPDHLHLVVPPVPEVPRPPVQ